MPVGDPPVAWVPDKHIEIVCLDYNWNDTTNMLTGTWEDYTSFNIYLNDFFVEQSGADPVIDNIKFTIIPEPTSLLLFSLGGLLINRKR